MDKIELLERLVRAREEYATAGPIHKKDLARHIRNLNRQLKQEGHNEKPRI